MFKRILLCLFISICIMLSYCNFYSSNDKIKDYYYNNSNALNEYINEFDESSFIKDRNEINKYLGSEAIIDLSDYNYTRLLYEIPDKLSEAGISSIESYDNYLFFDFPPTGCYYNYLYYSKDGKPSENCPIYSNEDDSEKCKFREVGKGIFVSGKKCSGIDWYKTEQIEPNWYYCEVHLS